MKKFLEMIKTLKPKQLAVKGAEVVTVVLAGWKLLDLAKPLTTKVTGSVKGLFNKIFKKKNSETTESE